MPPARLLRRSLRTDWTTVFAHETFSVNGEISSVCGGLVAQAFIAETAGFFKPDPATEQKVPATSTYIRGDSGIEPLYRVLR